MDYDVKKDYVMWWYEDYESKEIVEVYFPGGLEEQINERWKLFDWREECHPLKVY